MIVGFLLFDKKFFGDNFIELLMAHTEFQNTGIGISLIQHFEIMIGKGKIFTSKNRLNQKMHHLLYKLKSSDSGIIYHLDDNDPELIFFQTTIKIESEKDAVR